jgi:uncharacterized protein YecE (DUF72 family)
MTHPIRVGVGGWSFAPWNKTFYPAGLPARRQLEHMSRAMGAIEVNATYYSSFKPATFEKWAAESPDDFVFSLKAHRFSTVRKTPADMKKSINLFLGQGLTKLQGKLGPINWQFPPTRQFDPQYFEAFLSQLPPEKDGLKLRHALEVRGEGFEAPAFMDLLSRHGATVVWADDAQFPQLRHAGSPFAVARIMRARSELATGYTPKALAGYAQLLQGWSQSQDVFAFFISGAKERNPAAATALQQLLANKPRPKTRMRAAAKHK